MGYTLGYSRKEKFTGLYVCEELGECRSTWKLRYGYTGLLV